MERVRHERMDWNRAARIWNDLARRPVAAALLLVLLTLLAYGPAYDATFVLDDGLYVTDDARMATVDGLVRIWTEVGGPEYRHQYYPITGTVFWLQHRLWGDNPFGYHLVNVLLHAANAVLLWLLLRRLAVPGAWLAGLVFAVHPIHVPSVAWVAELKNVLSTSFFLMAGMAFLRWFGSGGDGIMGSWDPGSVGEAGETRSRDSAIPRSHAAMPRYVLGLALFVCALLSKTATCLLPVALALVLWWKRGTLRRRDLLPLAPLVALGAGFALLTVHLEASHGGARGQAFDESWMERGLVAARALWFYADRLVRPVGYMFIYPRWEIDRGAWWWYLYPLAAAVVIGALWLGRRRLGRGPLAAVAFFAVSLVPVAFVNVAFTRFSYVADHWAYWAAMGLIPLAVGTAAAWWERIPPGRARYGAWTAALAAVGALGLRTWDRAGTFATPQTLWRDTLTRNPRAWVAHRNLGAALDRAGRPEEAMHHYLAALALDPECADALNSAGAALRTAGRPEAAAVLFAEALRAEPGSAETHYNLANALRDRGDHARAVAHYREALRLGPDRAEVHNNLAVSLFAQGRLEESTAHFREALRINPDDPAARVNLRLAQAAMSSQEGG